ncbi:hypothetical protein N6L27_03585 [Leisingera sp. SS27]|uniref:hypothetical protein n=1 Tax=Leisingera sp. SS27 TaxID=2979462 RepID=UPI00232FFA94|nr:hypothetical protein [Leisingera sp. SS27]MDC0657072.1 hypothetical protein [Leisingera sp. SS27]
MSKKHLTQAIIDKWPNRKALLDDVNESLSPSDQIEIVAIHRWHQRGSIDGKYDLAILAGASKRNIPLSWHDLMAARSIHDDRCGHAAGDGQPRVKKTQKGAA